jgi:D-alanyl-D-alanine carboxypeptidase
MTQRKHLRGLAIAAATVVAAALFTLVPAAGAHVDVPNVTAQHAFIGDPLFGLDTAEGSLFGILPDERTAMASTTKLMTLDVTLHAVADGVVGLDDPVTVDAFAASLEPGNSVMATIQDPFCQFDANGMNLGSAWSPLSACVTLEPGEIVSLETLIRGMMYPSGNDAAWAIAFYVANAYGDDTNGDTVIDGNDFVERMNQHAVAIGLTDTHFTSANGWDDPGAANPLPEDLNHYTTARELSMTIDHGLDAHEHFGEVIGFGGTYTDTTQGPNGPKTYTWCWGTTVNGCWASVYPGWEGNKGGGSGNCSAGTGGCLGTSARRIGRRVVAGLMQSVTPESTMFDYGFGQIFHPDARGSSSTSGNAQRNEVVCVSNSRCVTAALPDSGDVDVVSWEPDIDGSSISILDQESVPKSALPPGNGGGQGPDGDVALTRLSSGAIVVANRKGSSVELSRWSMAGGGALSLLDSDIKMGPATTMDLQPVYSDMLLTAATDPEGELVLKSWQLDGSSLALLDTYRDDTRFYTEVAAGVPLTSDLSGHRAVTAALTPGVMVHDVWDVDETTGEIGLMGELVQGGLRDGVGITPFLVNTVFEGELFPPAYYATTFRSGGMQVIRYYRIGLDGTPIQEGLIAGGFVEEVAAARLGIGGLLVASRQADGTVQLDVWEARRNADNSISPDVVSQHTAPAAASLGLARVPSTHADGDYVTAVTDLGTGNLRLRAYRSGDRPF